jgi:hypothetical protein
MDLDLSRVRPLSRRFGWVDRRIFWDGHLAKMSQVEVAIYLVLCVIADRHGLCWCARKTLAAQTKHPADRIQEALRSLASRGLLAVQGRFIQVLEVTEPAPDSEDRSAPPEPTPVAAPGISPASSRVDREPAAVVLARLDPGLRENLLKRARAKMAPFLGCCEPLPSALEAVAAGLLDEGVR